MPNDIELVQRRVPKPRQEDSRGPRVLPVRQIEQHRRRRSPGLEPLLGVPGRQPVTLLRGVGVDGLSDDRARCVPVPTGRSGDSRGTAAPTALRARPESCQVSRHPHTPPSKLGPHPPYRGPRPRLPARGWFLVTAWIRVRLLSSTAEGAVYTWADDEEREGGLIFTPAGSSFRVCDSTGNPPPRRDERQHGDSRSKTSRRALLALVPASSVRSVEGVQREPELSPSCRPYFY
jgi:hypothetical protein